MEHAKLPLKMPETKNDEGPVTCLGMTFENDQERRAYFTEILRQKLPELKKNEGYPIGEDEDILALSDPPYYTACPNPFINDFIKEWEQEKEERYSRVEEVYHREPFIADVAEGKNDAIYNAHGYHTKVPYKAIMRYILHYTEPGDIILDAFSGTGMTGIAAGQCSNPEAKFKSELQKENSNYSYGARKAILADLSPAASFISHHYNIPSNVEEFQKQAKGLLEKCEQTLGWMYETNHVDDQGKTLVVDGKALTGTVTNFVWSDVLICPNCTSEIVFWDVAVDKVNQVIDSEFVCNQCSTNLTKQRCENAFESIYDEKIDSVVKMVKQIPVLILYELDGKRYQKVPDTEDVQKIRKINEMAIPHWFPSDRMVLGTESRRNDIFGITHVHHFYTKRNLLALAGLLKEINKKESLRPAWFVLTASLQRANKTNRFRFKGTGGLSGTLYIPSLVFERNVFQLFRTKLRDVVKAKALIVDHNSVVSTSSASSLDHIPADSVDYIFTDPPFGSNLNYSELSFIWEAWLCVITNNASEAIVNHVQKKGIDEYLDLMTACFSEYYRVLKPERWMTVIFSNSQASVWNVIQEAIQRTGFIMANVSALDKKQGSFKAVTTTTAVKQDLVISAYKPSTSMIEEIRTTENTEESAWTFVRNHLWKLPVFVGKKGEVNLIVERTPRILFDRMVAYHVQNGYSVPISSAEFQEGVAQRFPMRDGMVFLETQVTEYDKKRLLAKEFVQTTLFVSDENSAIEWLRQQLMQKPQTRQDLHPNFMKELQHISKHELLPELDVLLEQNFLMYDGTDLVPSQIHGYLSTDFKDLRNLDKEDPKLQAKAKNRWYAPDPNKQADLEKLRERSLLREFNGYIEELGKSKKKLRQFRTEAIRAGFKNAWANQDYKTIVDVGHRLPERVLQEDSTMLMYYDNAQIRLGM